MYRAIDDRVRACSTTHVGVEDAETASVSIGTGWFVIKAFFFFPLVEGEESSCAGFSKIVTNSGKQKYEDTAAVGCLCKDVKLRPRPCASKDT
jgi:hypothetical protein